MIEQFDKQLRDHIKDTFDVYDDLMANDGWKKYQRKVKRKKYGALIWWTLPSGIAATFALAWLLNIETFNDIDKSAKIIAHNKTENNNLIASKADTVKIADYKLNSKHNLNDKVITTKTSNKAFKTTKFKAAESTQLAITQAAPPHTNTINNTTTQNEENLVVENIISTNNSYTEVPNSFYQQEIVSSNNIETIANNKAENGFTNSFSDFASKLSKNLTEDVNKDNLKSNKIKIGLDASTFLNFTNNGLGQDMNLAVGITSEIKIAKNLSVNSGININKQSASYASNVEINSSQSFKQPSDITILTANAMATPIPSESFLNAKFIGFDIPFALKYSSNNKNRNWFISTGFSAYTILSESYSNNTSFINYGLNGIHTTNEITTESHKDDLFSNLQLARTLNFSVGITFPIKNETFLSVEPFLKYPVNGFGREDLAIGSSGVSLKMNFAKNLFK